MKDIKITLPDSSIKVVGYGTKASELASNIGPGLARAAIVAKVDGQLKDLSYQLKDDCNVEFLTGEDPEGHSVSVSYTHLRAHET